MDFSQKGYTLSKTIIYMISEVDMIDSRDMENNKNLKAILHLKKTFNIPLVILLTHSDIFCEKIKRVSKDWKNSCSLLLNKNKKNLLSWINKTINNRYEMKENDIKHVMLQENKKEITNEEVFKSFDEETLADYEKEDDHGKELMIKTVKKTLMKKENEVIDYLKNVIKVLGPKELIEEIKNYIPSQFHNTFNDIK